ncbi:unnamed protein product, partial [Candidula unifasciata]
MFASCDSVHGKQVHNGNSTDRSDQTRLSPVFRLGQSRLGKHALSTSKLATPEFGQTLPNAHTSITVSPVPTYSTPINSIPRPNSQASIRSPVPHHSVYESSTGNLFRSIASPAQTPSTSASPASLRMTISRPDGVCLMPRRKSHSESTVSRYVGIEGSSARSRGLAAFSDLSSGYQPLSNQSPPSSHPSSSTSASANTLTSSLTSSSALSAAPERAVNSSVSRHLEMLPGSVSETSSRQPRSQLNSAMVSRMRQMYNSWTAAVAASGDTHDVDSRIYLLPLDALGQGGLTGRRALPPRGILQGAGLPAWWHSSLIEQPDTSPDTPKSFPSVADEQFYEEMEPSSQVKNYASLIKKAGPYILGPRIGSSPVHSIVQCLARREKTSKFYILKILTLPDPAKETTDDRQGKMLMLTEFSLLSHLKDMKGVVHCIDFFKDKAFDPKQKCEVTRLCLLVDCFMPHDYDPESQYLVNLQHHVIHEKKLGEKEALIIFWDIARIVEQLHKTCRYNMIVDRRSWRVTITNFCLGKHLSSEKDKLKDQRGSPAYISPDVLSGKPYCGKPSDMWALGVVLFTMLYGQFPFYDSMPQELFRKIKSAEFTIPNDGRVSEDTKQLIHQLLILDAQTRMTAGQVVDALESIIGK